MSLLENHMLVGNRREIAYVGAIVNPADNSAGAVATVTFGISALTFLPGDFVFVHMMVGSAGPRTLTVTTAAGQTWTSIKHRTNLLPEIWTSWCTFNGTWTTNPQFSISGSGVAKSYIMHVFRGPYQGGTWAVDQAASQQDDGVSSTSTTVTGLTNTQARNLTITSFINGNSAAQFVSITGANWYRVPSPSLQYRNQGSNGKSLMYAYQQQGLGIPVGATGNVTLTTDTSDFYYNLIQSFYYT